jgi:hypothetical protein
MTDPMKMVPARPLRPPACAMQTACLGHIPRFEHIREQASAMARANIGIARRAEQGSTGRRPSSPRREQGPVPLCRSGEEARRVGAKWQLPEAKGKAGWRQMSAPLAKGGVVVVRVRGGGMGGVTSGRCI